MGLLVFGVNSKNHLILCKQMSSKNSFKNKAAKSAWAVEYTDCISGFW